MSEPYHILLFLVKTPTFFSEEANDWCEYLSKFCNRLCGPIVVVLLCLPSFVLSGSKVIIRPEFDESFVPQRSFYPYKVLRRPKIALVLSGGGARGVAQIGVLKVFERHNIPIDFISATSLGAIIGGLYASGYTPAEIESLALNTNWDEVLSLTEDTKRTALFVDQKLATDRSFLSLRFEGLEPVIPAALSSGQPLTNFLSTQTLQALYHPNPSFDDLKVRFRVVCTDLISGKRVIIKEGSLAEALRATAGVPLLFNPIDKDSMKLVDGGLVSNIPADVAKAEGYDIIIAVNSTSGLRNEQELKAPWQTADQIMGIMMQLSNQQQLKLADVVITPQVGRHLSSDFQGLDSLIAEGELAAESKLDDIMHIYEEKAKATDNKDNHVLTNPIVETSGDGVPDSLWKIVRRKAESGKLTTLEIRHHVNAIYASGDYRDVYAEVFPEEQPSRVIYTTASNPRLQFVEFEGCKLIAPEILQAKFAPLVGKPVNHRSGDVALDNVLRLYRAKGYSLARIEATSFDAATGVLHIVVNEGVIHRIDVQGGVRAKDYVVLREFPLEEGDVFDINKANRGVININGTTLFENVYLEVSYLSKDPILTIRLQERPSQLIRFGLRADDERNLQGSLDIRDENLGGTGTDIGLNVAGGSRNHDVVLEYKAHRLFNTYLTFGVSAFYSVFDTYIYGDAEQTRLNHWERVRFGEYRDMRYGGKLVFGAQLERIGNTTVELSVQNVRIKNKENAESLEQRYRLSRIRFGTVVDTKDSYPFPTGGIGLTISYEFAIEGLGSEVSYNALKVVYESYTTWRNRHTFHPKITIGFADRTMPLGEQFRLGGRELMFGTREDDRRGRQLLLLNIEYRYRFPIRILFDTFLRLRYDLGNISTVPEEIKFATLKHGVGAELAFDTPVGQAAFGVGRSFFFGRELPNNPTQWGPVLFYFVIGYQL